MICLCMKNGTEKQLYMYFNLSFCILYPYAGCSSDSDGTEKADPVKPDDFTVMEGVEDLAEAGGFTLLDLPGGEPQSASNINSSSKAEPTGHATVTGLQCTGTEYSLRQCKHTGYQDRKFPCSNCKFAAVECAYGKLASHSC